MWVYYFFSKDVQKFFPYVKIEIVTFYDESGTNHTEKIFTGQIHNQLQGALSYFKDSVIREQVKKIEDVAEASRFYNYPYAAIEEALCNAVYHRGYDNDSTIEIRIYPKYLSIISYPGPLPPLDKVKLQNLQFDTRKYRNRRIGDFLKELHLTEGRATGIPTILNSLEANGSPKPIFETDDERTYFKTTIHIHPDYRTEDNVKITTKGNLINVTIDDSIDADSKNMRKSYEEGTMLALSWHQVSTKLALSKDAIVNILEFCKTPQTLVNMMTKLNWKDKTKFRRKYITPFIEMELIEMVYPNKPNSPNQMYRTTEKGISLLRPLTQNTNNPALYGL
jgi:ATP-dependent DNA helicase RecG